MRRAAASKLRTLSQLVPLSWAVPPPPCRSACGCVSVGTPPSLFTVPSLQPPSRPDNVALSLCQLITGVDWAPKSNMLVTCSHDRTCSVWTKSEDGKGWKPQMVVLKDFGRGVGCFTADVIDTFFLPADDILFDRFGYLRALEFPTA